MGHWKPAGVGRGHPESGTHPHTLHISIRISMHSQKIDSILSDTFTHHTILQQTCPAPFALTPSMLPIANPFHAPVIPVPRVHAAHATKLSSAATMFPFQSACSATLYSLILSFSTSVYLNHSYKGLSQSTNKTFYSHKNTPCYLPHKPPSLTTNLYKILTIKSRTFKHKSNNFSHLNPIYYKPNAH